MHVCVHHQLFNPVSLARVIFKRGVSKYSINAAVEWPLSRVFVFIMISEFSHSFQFLLEKKKNRTL